MVTWLRRMFWLGLLGGGAYGGWAWWQRSRAADDAPPEWPPLDTASGETSTEAGSDTARVAAAVPTAGAAEADAESSERRWAEPVDGECPEGYPIKANDNSGIYHEPGGRFYDRTTPERCYASAADAEADGYRAAKT